MTSLVTIREHIRPSFAFGEIVVIDFGLDSVGKVYLMVCGSQEDLADYSMTNFDGVVLHCDAPNERITQVGVMSGGWLRSQASLLPKGSSLTFEM